MPMNTSYGGVYIEVTGNISPFVKRLKDAHKYAQKVARNISEETGKFFNEAEIAKTAKSITRHLTQIQVAVAANMKDFSQFNRHIEHIVEALGLTDKHVKALGKDIEQAFRHKKELEVERSLRSLQRQIGLTDQAYMNLARSLGASEAAFKKAQGVLDVRLYSQVKQEICPFIKNLCWGRLR